MNTALAAYLPKFELNFPDSVKSNMENLAEYLPKVELNAVNVLKIATGATIGFVVIYCGKIWYSYRFFKKRGIKTPKYKFISGNLNEIIENNYSDTLKQWTEQYGKVYGYYEGHLPIMVTSDLEIVQEIFIKQFSNFTARKQVPFQQSDDSPNINLFLSSRNRWRRIRNIVNPTFTPAKLKQILPLMKVSSERLIKFIENNSDREIDIADYFDCFTMDVVFNCVFGIDIDCLNNPENMFFVKSRQFFKNLSNFNFIVLMNMYFYELKRITIPLLSFGSLLASKINNKLGNPFFWLAHNVHQIIKQRTENNKKLYRNDYVQILIEAKSENFNNESIDKQFNEASKIRLEKKLTINEVNFNLLGFMIAGYETTSSTLAHCIHVFLKHPNEITKVREEIEQHFPLELNIDQVDPDYESIQKLQYLDYFVKEVLRMYPIANNVIARRCTNATKVKGMDIPVGLIIAVDVLSLHYDPKIWGPVDPNKFYPLRFDDEDKKNTLAYMPFGIGPRICVGMRFALLEIKLALIKILQNYDLTPGASTKNIMEFSEGAIRKPKYGVPVVFKKRLN